MASSMAVMAQRGMTTHQHRSRNARAAPLPSLPLAAFHRREA
jgi:hypothetical protein